MPHACAARPCARTKRSAAMAACCCLPRVHVHKAGHCSTCLVRCVHRTPQEKQGVITAEGQLLPPRWVIRDMMWQSMLALV